MASCPELLDGRGVIVDVGYGESPVTTLELAHAVREVTPSLRVVGVERKRGQAAFGQGSQVHNRRAQSSLSPLSPSSLELVEGDFGSCATLGPTAVVRAMNVLRGYREEEVPAIHAALGAALVEGGLVLEGSTDTDGHVTVAHLLRRRGGRLVREALLFHTDFSRGFSPWLFRDWLPRDLRRRATPGTAIHELLKRWEAQAKGGDPRARFLSSVRGIVDASPWEMEHGFARWTRMQLKVPPVKVFGIDAEVAFFQAALQRLLGGSGALPVSQLKISEEEIPDDRPTQSSGTRYVTELRLGERAVFRCTQEVGGWLQGSSDWRTADFAGLGALSVSFDSGGVTIEAAPDVAEAMATILRQ
ncbi:MAG: hypothetical protein Q8L48_28550 [Archangium sp.]|nr:hypothetical protein [Archangium sp.]